MLDGKQMVLTALATYRTKKMIIQPYKAYEPLYFILNIRRPVTLDEGISVT